MSNRLSAENITELAAEIRRALEAVHGERLKGIVLHGSLVRGATSADSDIDVLVLLQGPIHLWSDTRTNLMALNAVSAKYCRTISPKPVDSSVYEAGEFPLYATAHVEGVRV